MTRARADRRSTVGWLAAVAVLLSAVGSTADECPYEALKAAPKAETALGSWELQARSSRMDFPAMADKGEVRSLRLGMWGMPVNCDARVSVRPAALDIRVAGYRMVDPDADGWVPLVVFVPKEPGAYALTGNLKIWFDGAPTAKDAVQWAVLTVKTNPPMGVVAGDKVGNGAEIKFSELAPLKAVNLAAGEALGIMVWRSASRNVCGGTLSGLAVAKATEPAKAATP